MSDCGIYGNKNWQRAVDKASDKPEHGTGSGEATCPTCGSAACEGTHMSTTSAVVPPTWATPPASSKVALDRETLAQKFHEAYERLAPQFGYRTREASAVPWADVPEQNKQLMIAVAGEVLALLRAAEQKQPTNGTEAVLAQAKKESALLYDELTKLKAQVKDLLNHLSSSGT